MRLSVKTSVKVNVDIGARALRASTLAIRIVAPELNSAFQDAIGSRVWDHPRPTVRSNGQTVTAPRNIVDLGILKASNSFEINGNLVTYQWAVNYAAAQHWGANIYPWGNKKAKKVNLPPKPWTSAVLGTIKVGGIQPYDYKSTLKIAFITSWNRNA